MNRYSYSAVIVRVVDGDTVYAKVDLGFHVYVEMALRLNGIDTAEIFRPVNDIERTHGMKAKNFLIDLILNKKVVINTHKTGKYGRWIADIYLDDKSVVQELIDNKFEKRSNYLLLEGVENV
jgi:endonuclease YncB( thermonuclease family)